MSKLLPNSELILNSDGSIYHLNLLPEDIATNIILVGDPDRVAWVSSFFDTIRVKKNKREFVTHTGTYQGKEITVISTGIGTDNIDIVLNELDAICNIDFKNRAIKEQKKSLSIVRLGTSGSIQSKIDIDTFLISSFAIGMDSMMHFYQYENTISETKLLAEFENYLQEYNISIAPYVFSANSLILKKFEQLKQGITLTHNGFYAPQGRELRATSKFSNYIDIVKQFNSSVGSVVNFEMETAGIYGLSSVLQHQAVSISLILANREKGTFSDKYEMKMKELIEYTLEKI